MTEFASGIERNKKNKASTPEGMILAGPEGVGKSTFLHMISAVSVANQYHTLDIVSRFTHILSHH
jgi:hypothetical protein